MYRQDIEVHSDLRKQEAPVQDKYYGCPGLKVQEDRQRKSVHIRVKCISEGGCDADR